MEKKYIHKIAELQGIGLSQVENVQQLHGGGATVPFMARYRKEATGNLDEVQINDVVEKIQYFNELDKRKETVLKTIEAAKKLTEELKNRIINCFDATALEDIYLPFKPKRKTRATTAVEKGLQPLAALIIALQGFTLANETPLTISGEINVDDEAARFINDLVPSKEEALQGARDILAEWTAENEQARNAVRHLFSSGAMISSKVLKAKKETEDAQKYRDYFEFSELLANCPSHRMLAIRRGEKEGFLAMDITIDQQQGFDALKKIFIKKHNSSTQHVSAAIEDSFERLLKPSIENEFRLIGKNSADDEAIKVFAENLRQLMLASPLGSKKIMAIDPGFRTGCKVVCLDAQGNFLHYSSIFPHQPQMETAASISEIKKLAGKYEIEAIGIGNGTAGRETEQFIRAIDFGKPVSVFMVNESGASIYSASEVAREEFPDQDVTVRGSISIGRRLLDPLSELVKIDAKSIGVGQYQHDVNQTRLKEELDKVVESCVNHVGVDLNTASRHLLGYISGLSATLAKNIVEYRLKNGPYKTREEIKKVSLMGSKSFEQSAGFMRIPGSTNPLDNSAVHPESYFVVEAMAKDLNCSVKDLVGDALLRTKIDRKKYISDSIGQFTIEDIIKELEKPGRDPRAQAEEFRFDDKIKSIGDVKAGMVVPGIVTNITNFGAFVDIGVKQDGLLHISQMSNTFISDPNQAVKLQQRVIVTITDVDVSRKRISLSMKDAQKERQQTSKPSAPVIPNKKNEPQNAFQSKLMELKKKFKD
ncbi:MAG: RNA-binding transcriptional accessory protein [Chitinophagaceae bacterium]|nr:RNA-binding transcriptional accessory protein [Chitinophagaceae bacterium]